MKGRITFLWLLMALFWLSHHGHAESAIKQAAPLTDAEHARMMALPVAEDDIQNVQRIVSTAFPIMQQLAAQRAESANVKFTPPTLEYYGYPDKPVPECREKLAFENAFYCIPKNQLFLDIFWLVRVAKFVNDGTSMEKYAVLTVLGHEMGHAADYKFNLLVREGRGSWAWGVLHEVVKESSADCFAGAAVARLVQDLPEQENPRAVSTGMRAIFTIQGDFTDREYPPGEVRMKTFKTGFEQGSSDCFKH